MLLNTHEHRELIKANVRLSNLATIDALTQLFNRSSINQFLDREFSHWRRMPAMQSSIAVAMIDIDHFKRVNDTYGHIIGDEVLREFSKRLHSAVRTDDLLGRYGGEEFLALLLNTDVERAWAVGERIRRTVCECPFVVGLYSLELTASIGIAIIPNHNVAQSDALACADQALYKAKTSGRNRVMVYQVSSGTNVVHIPLERVVETADVVAA